MKTRTRTKQKQNSCKTRPTYQNNHNDYDSTYKTTIMIDSVYQVLSLSTTY